MRFQTAAVLILLSTVLSAYQGDYGTESVFTAGAGAAAEAMGGAYTAAAEDISSVYYNPAGLSFMQRQGVSFLHYPLFEGAMYDFVSYAHPVLDFGVVASSFYRFTSGEIQGYDAEDKMTGTFSVDEYKASVSYARAISPQIRAGLNINVFSTSINDVTGVGFGADAGIVYMPFTWLRAGFTAHNIIKPVLKMDNSDEGVPQRYSPAGDIRAGAGADVSLGEAEGIKVKAGCELGWQGYLKARAGYNDGRFSMGGGIGAAGAVVDYAFVTGGYEEAMHRFSVAYNFGLTLKEQKEEARKEMLKEVRKLVEEKINRFAEEKAAFHYRKAYEYYGRGEKEKALNEAEKALEWKDDHAPAVKMKAIIEASIRERLYKEASARGKKRNESSLIKGLEHYMNRQFSRAAAEWEKALETDPANSSLKLYLSKARMEMKKQRSGIAGNLAKSKEAEKLYYEGINAYTAGELEKALSLWNRVSEIVPEDIRTLRSIEKVKAEIEELRRRGIK